MFILVTCKHTYFKSKSKPCEYSRNKTIKIEMKHAGTRSCSWCARMDDDLIVICGENKLNPTACAHI